MAADTDHTGHRNYSLATLEYVVRVPINGGTDWYTEAAFEYAADARQWADMLNKRGGEDGPYRSGPAYVEYIGNRWSFDGSRA